MNRITLQFGDITQLEVDAIVNAANEQLNGGTGVDGAIHAAGGSQLLEECLTLGGCPTGEARITNGYNLEAKHVIHTVGPIWEGGHENEPQLLENCYKNSLRLASENGIRTIAFPAISTGGYGFPPDQAAQIAVKTTKAFLKNNKLPEKVIFVCFDQASLAYYEEMTITQSAALHD
ncbi:MAG: O-acetyl-ADP-ribose deacetylase [Verrucomicrobia bacterium]|nr:O-acetyl-ADP-ribose deacetylase [Verrucomicrobiota bacterium]